MRLRGIRLEAADWGRALIHRGHTTRGWATCASTRRSRTSPPPAAATAPPAVRSRRGACGTCSRRATRSSLTGQDRGARRRCDGRAELRVATRPPRRQAHRPCALGCVSCEDDPTAARWVRAIVPIAPELYERLVGVPVPSRPPAAAAAHHFFDDLLHALAEVELAFAPEAGDAHRVKPRRCGAGGSARAGARPGRSGAAARPWSRRGSGRPTGCAAPPGPPPGRTARRSRGGGRR